MPSPERAPVEWVALLLYLALAILFLWYTHNADGRCIAPMHELPLVILSPSERDEGR
jgi:hypothetical protein